MYFDLHFHTKQHSSCSTIDMEEGVRYAKEIGLAGICITDHDTFACRKSAAQLQDRYGILVVVGTEILTVEGDLLCFGLDEVPDVRVEAQTLIDHINRIGGACIAAHPFRKNNRGMGEHLYRLKGLHAIETPNGNTEAVDNRRARKVARELNIPCTGGSDAHRLERIGVCPTRFTVAVNSESDLIMALRNGNVCDA